MDGQHMVTPPKQLYVRRVLKVRPPACGNMTSLPMVTSPRPPEFRLSARGRGLGLASGPDQSVLVGVDDGLDPVPQAQLGQDPAHARLHCPLRHAKPPRQLRAPQSEADLDQ